MVNKNFKNNEYCDGYNYNNYKDKVETGKDLYYDDFTDCTLKKSLERLIGSLYRPHTQVRIIKTGLQYWIWEHALYVETCTEKYFLPEKSLKVNHRYMNDVDVG